MSGYWGRMVRRLTLEAEELDADDLSRTSSAAGAQRTCDCACGEEVTLLGRLRSVELCPREAVATLEAELFDGSEGIILVWLGRRRIPGFFRSLTLFVKCLGLLRGALGECLGNQGSGNEEWDDFGHWF